MLGPVRTFREKAESDTVIEDVRYLVHRIEVLDYIAYAIPFPHHRQDTEKCDYPGSHGILEYICPCTEYGHLGMSPEDDECVHESVAVIGCKYHCPVGREIFSAPYLHGLITTPYTPVKINLKYIISEVWLVNRSHYALYLFVR